LFGRWLDEYRVRVTPAYTYSRPVEIQEHRSSKPLDEVVLFGRELNQRERAEVRLFMLRRSHRASRWEVFKARLATYWFRLLPA
jgi:hypothetical protein